MKCKCLEQVQEQLAKHNQTLVFSFTFDGNTYINIATEKIDKTKRTKQKSIIAAYCPFCGKKYDKSES